jgi:NADPH-dependent 2,4-dienoyl-CoA reductase/sulfur reductase-like enzyme
VGLTCTNGIVVDSHMRSSAPKIYAIGDCTAADNPYLGGRFRIETIHNATSQAQIAARSLCGLKAPAPTAAPS